MLRRDQRLRHSPAARLAHWTVALSGLLLAFSGIGFMPLYGRFYLDALPGLGWVSDFQVQMDLHYLSAALFLAACLFHLFYHWRRREFSLVPRRGDIGESWQIAGALLGNGPEPAHGKFLAEQRLAYAAFAATFTLLTVSGYLLAAKHALGIFAHPALVQALVLVHLAATFLFLALVVLHLAAFLLKANRPLLPAMFHGRVDTAYARRRHPRWPEGPNGERPPKSRA